MPAGDERLGERVFGLGDHIRYVAIGRGQEVTSSQREGLSGASDAGSDFYEELLVNPALLGLARSRGELDCGGLRHLVVGYGNFDQVVIPLPGGDGHISVCVELGHDPGAVAEAVRALLGGDGSHVPRPGAAP